MSTEAHVDSTHSAITAMDMPATHGTVGGYLTGFILSVILTAIPFWLVMSRQSRTQSATALVDHRLAVVQIVVHMIYFLHMSPRSEGGWSMMALIFTLVLVVIALSRIAVGDVPSEHQHDADAAHDMSQMP